MKERQYQSPGGLFIDKFGVPRDSDDVVRYADFLRQEAGLSDQPPVDLTKIFGHFGIRSRPAPLVDQQGLSDGLLGFMLIKDGDPAVRRRFSQAHELIEFLFHEFKTLPEWGRSYYSTHPLAKEKLCQRGAAKLLMPSSSFAPIMLEQGVSLESASVLAGMYETSLLATLNHMLTESKDNFLLVVWRYGLKPKQAVQQQAGLFGDSPVALPQKKLRIWWPPVTSAGANNGFIPLHQSVHDGSVIVKAYETGQLHYGKERFQLKGIQGDYQVQAKRITIGDEVCVLSLLQCSD